MILARPSTASIPATKYLALFKVETSDIAAVKQAATRPGTTSPAFDTQATRCYTFRAIGPVIEGDKVRAARAKQSPCNKIASYWKTEIIILVIRTFGSRVPR
jgi:hypothetical protein